jgi:hypothetical protein
MAPLFEEEMTYKEVLPIVAEIEGNERSKRRQLFLEETLTDRGDAGGEGQSHLLLWPPLHRWRLQ